MLFLQQLRGELQKLLARPRTWIGYGAFLIMEALILFVYKLERSQQPLDPDRARAAQVWRGRRQP